MDAVVLDPGLLACLANAKGPVRLRTADGRLLGTYTPAAPFSSAEPPAIPEEELRKRESRKEGRTWAEIKADLEKRG